MKKLFNIFLLCLMALTATAQSSQTRRLQVKALPDRVFSIRLIYDVDYESYCVYNTTKDIDEQVPVGKEVEIDISVLGDYNGMEDFKLVGWKVNGVAATLAGEDHSNTKEYKFVMPNADIELVGTFEYDPSPDEDENPALGGWDPTTGTLIKDYEGSSWPLGFNFDEDRTKVLRFIEAGSFYGKNEYDYCVFSNWQFPYCNVWDISRTNSQSAAVSYYEEEPISLQEVILPATITKLKYDAFRGANLSTLVLYALTPPECGSIVHDYYTGEDNWKTPFPDCTDMTVRVPAEAVPLYQAADHWKDFTILAIDGTYANITLKLMATPNDYVLSQYKNMSIVLTNKTSGQTQRNLMNGRNEYEFRYLTTKCIYKLQLLNDRNVEVAAIDNIYLNEENLTVTFDYLRRIHQMSLMLSANGMSVSEKLYDVIWLNSEGNYIRKSLLLPDMLDDEQLRCIVTIDRSLAMNYKQPDTLSVTVGADGQPDVIPYALQPIQNTPVTFNVVDSLTRSGISDVVVQITQLLSNGEAGQTTTLTTNNNGLATGEALATLSHVIITSTVHGSQEFNANLADSTSFRTLFLPANGTEIQLSHTYQAAVPDSVEPTIESYYNDGRSLEYEFHALLPNNTDSLMSHYITRYPNYTLYTDLPQGTKVRVIATDTRGQVETVEAEGTVDENNMVKVTLPIVERGYVEVQYYRSASRNPALLIFNAETGELVQKQGFGNAMTTRISNLNDGQYLVAAMSKGIQYQTINSKSQLYLYVEGTDYVIDTVNVSNGHAAKVSFTVVPLSTTMLETNLSERRASWGDNDVTVGFNAGLNIEVSFKDVVNRWFDLGDYIAGVNINDDTKYPQNCKLEIYMPEGLRFESAYRHDRLLEYGSWRSNYGSDIRETHISGTLESAIEKYENLKAQGEQINLWSMTAKKASFACQTEWNEAERKVTIDWPRPYNYGVMKVSTIVTEAGYFTPEIYITYTYKGKQYREILEPTSLTTNKSGINVPELVIKPSFHISGKAMYYEEPQDSTAYARLKAQISLPVGSLHTYTPPKYVTVMDGNQPIGKAEIKQDGKWETSVTLVNPTILSKHNIYAKIEYPNGVKYQTESRELTYNPNGVVALSTKMSFFNHHPVHLINTEVLFDYVNDKATPDNYGYDNRDSVNTDFTFEVNLSTNDTTKVYACALFIYTDGPDAEERISMAHYNARKNRWIAYEKFNTRSLPYAVVVEPYYYEDVMGSREEVNKGFSFYDYMKDLNATKLDSLLAVSKAFWNQAKTKADRGENVDATEIIEIENQIDELLGISIAPDAEPVDTAQAMAAYDELQEKYPDLNTAYERMQALYSKAMNELGEILNGITIGKPEGMTEESMESNGFISYKLDDGSKIYFHQNEDGSIVIVDLIRDTKMTLSAELTAAARAAKAGDGVHAGEILLKSAEEALELINKIAEFITYLGNTVSLSIVDTQKAIEALEIVHKADMAEAAKRVFNLYPDEVYRSIRLDFLKGEKWFLEKCQKGLDGFNRAGFVLSLINYVKDLYTYCKKIYKAEELSVDINYYFNDHKNCDDEGLSNRALDLAFDTEAKVVGLVTAAILSLKASQAAMIASAAPPTMPEGLIALGVSLGGTLTSLYGSTVFMEDFQWEYQYIQNRFIYLRKICDMREDCRTKGNCPDCVKLGTCPNWPKGPKYPKRPKTDPILDPSGFVYEGLESNRLEGVTTTVFYKETKKNIFGEEVENVYLWDAENYGQINPQVTDANGEYGWMVPSGLWQVKYEKQGYQTEHSEWLPVPPPQLDVNQDMKPTSAPVVQDVKATTDAVTIKFDMYMKADSLTNDRIFVTHNGELVAGTIEPQLTTNESETWKRIANKVRFVPTTTLPVGQQLTLTVKGSVESYAGVPMGDDFQQEFDIVQAVEQLVADSAVHVIYDQSEAITIQAIPAAAAVGKKASVQVLSDMIASADKQELTFDAQGKATLTVTGEAHGSTAIVLQMTDDADVTKIVMVNVKDETDFVCPMPTANYQVGMELPYGSLTELTCSLPEATIYYTLDGTCPCAETSPSVKKYEAPIPLTAELLIKAFAKAPGYADSEVVELKFMVDAIQTIPVSYKVPTATYTLQGVKVNDSQPLRKGLYIRGNKKIIVR